LKNVYGKEAEKGISFFKVLLKQHSVNNTKVKKMDVLRICDWLQGADDKWVSVGWRDSFFFQYYMGEKDESQITKDAIYQDNSKCFATLYWDATKIAFIVAVKLKGKWEQHHTLTTKTICYDDLKKEAQEICKDKNIQWVPSAPFDHLNKGGGIFNHMYTISAGVSDGKSTEGKIASIYVY